MRTLLLSTLALALLLPACSSSPQPANLNGQWAVDMSPNQDGSNVQSLTMAMDPTNQYDVTASTFGGSVYGSTPISNGQVMNHEGKTVFSFTTADQTGTSTWLGGMTSSGGMQGTMRTPDGRVSRWSATPGSLNPGTPGN